MTLVVEMPSADELSPNKVLDNGLETAGMPGDDPLAGISQNGASEVGYGLHRIEPRISSTMVRRRRLASASYVSFWRNSGASDAQTFSSSGLKCRP
jgi:hypothetical protein